MSQAGGNGGLDQTRIARQRRGPAALPADRRPWEHEVGRRIPVRRRARLQTAPFAATGSGATLDYTTTNPQGQRSIRSATARRSLPTHDGKQVFLDTGVLDAVKELVSLARPVLRDVRQRGITAAMTKLDAAFNAVQTVVGDTGAGQSPRQHRRPESRRAKRRTSRRSSPTSRTSTSRRR